MQETVGLSDQVGAALAGITGAVSVIEHMNQQIATPAEEQCLVAQEVSRNLVHLQDEADQCAQAHDHIIASMEALGVMACDLLAAVAQCQA